MGEAVGAAPVDLRQVVGVVIPLRLYAYAAIALFIGYLLWREHYLAGRVKALRESNAELVATIDTERANTRKANESAQRYASRLAVSRGPRSPPPRIVCRIPAQAPAAASTAASGTDAAAATDDPGVSVEADLGPRIDVPFRACEENLIKLEELQRWVRERS
jgi:cytoskeletal protein RodZ